MNNIYYLGRNLKCVAVIENGKRGDNMEYINAKRTPQQENELRRQLAQENAQIRKQERQHIDRTNGTKTVVTTRSIK